jgi:hypothetical protein
LITFFFCRYNLKKRTSTRKERPSWLKGWRLLIMVLQQLMKIMSKFKIMANFCQDQQNGGTGLRKLWGAI